MEENKSLVFTKQYTLRLAKILTWIGLVLLCLTSLFSILLNVTETNPIQPNQKHNLFLNNDDQFYKQSTALWSDQTNRSDRGENQVVKKWNLQKNIWIYKDSQKNNKNPRFNTLNLQNTKYFAGKDSYRLIELEQNNYKTYLSAQAKLNITKIFQRLDIDQSKFKDKNIRQQLLKNKQNIKKRLIIYYVLLQNGGIFIDNKITVVERFNWIQNIMSLPYINVGDTIEAKIQPKCFGFFERDYGSIKTKLNVKRKYEFEKKLIMFPSLQQDFLACSSGNQYLRKLIETYVNILSNKNISLVDKELDTEKILIGKTQPKSIYKHGHLIANHIILQKRQRQLNQIHNPESFIKLAIDDFGLISINTLIGPRKMQFSFSSRIFKRSYIYLSKLMIIQLQRHLGKLRFVFQLEKNVVQLIEKQIVQVPTQMDYIVQNSFIHTYFLKHLPQSTLTITQNINFNNKKAQSINFRSTQFKKIQILASSFNQSENINKPQWQSIPKHVWTIWDTGIPRNATFIVQLCLQNLKRSAKNSGFQFHIISSQNIHEYIDNDTLTRINQALLHVDYKITRSGVADIWRIALLLKHGGIYIDSTTFTMEQNFDWLINITRIPSNFLWNRHGEHPQVLMYWNPYNANDMNWKTHSNIKSNWQLSFGNYFIASSKDNQFMKEWLEVTLEWTVMTFDKIQQQMKQVGMNQNKWSSRGYRYLLAMDSIKYVLGRRQKYIKDQNIKNYAGSSDYYKFWSSPVQMVGIMKFRMQQNFQNIDYRLSWNQGAAKQIYRYEYSLEYVESVKGQILFASKFYEHGTPINNMMMNFYQKNRKNFNLKKFDQIIHPQSLFGQKLLHKYPQKALYLLSYYSNLVNMRINFRGLNSLGL